MSQNISNNHAVCGSYVTLERFTNGSDRPALLLVAADRN
jgi:hypothetical protein